MIAGPIPLSLRSPTMSPVDESVDPLVPTTMSPVLSSTKPVALAPSGSRMVSLANVVSLMLVVLAFGFKVDHPLVLKSVI
jgi:hypothetical protein